VERKVKLNGTRKDIVKKMIKIGAVKKGEFILSSGKKSNIYIDIKLACCYPDLLDLIADCIAEKLRNIDFDVVACVELGGVPVATAVSLKTGKRMTIFRKKKKDYGIKDDLIGVLNEGERAVVVEDVTTTGGSALSVVERVRSRKCVARHVIAVVDREEGAAEKLEEAGVKLIPVLKLSEILPGFD